MKHYKKESRSRYCVLIVFVAVLLYLVVSTRSALAITIVNNSEFEMSIGIDSENGEDTNFVIPPLSEMSLTLGANLRVHVETVGQRAYWSHSVSADDCDRVIIDARSTSSVDGRSRMPGNLEVQVSRAGVATVVAAQHSGPGGRDVRFLASADPQYNLSESCSTPGDPCYEHNAVADLTMQAMRDIVFDGTGVKGIVIAGDLTQNTWANEFCRYVDSAGGVGFFDDCADDVIPCNFLTNHSECDAYNSAAGSLHVYDGLGNHDYEYGDLSIHGIMDTEIRNWVWRSRARPLFKFDIPFPGVYRPHYSWDWEDVHFVQLNLYPGTDSRPCFNNVGSCDPDDSITFLQIDLAQNVGGDSTRPIVLIHHYGFEPFSLDDSHGWDVNETVTFWNVISDYNVIAILSGHTNRIATQCSRFDFVRPTGAVPRPDGRTSIPAFEAGSAKGRDGPEPGAYMYINVHKGHQIKIERRGVGGDDNDVNRVYYSWCLPVDSKFYLDPAASPDYETGTMTRPFGSLGVANDAMNEFDPNCSLDKNPACETLTGGTPLAAPTLFVSESRHTSPIRLDAPMRIVKWNQ